MGLVAGTRLGPYEIQAPLGAGGMGEVYRAVDTRLGRPVAVKVLPEELALDATRLARFEQEARAASALNHPNILTLFDVGPPGAAPYLVTELLEGSNLRLLIDGKGLPVAKVQDYAVQIARGLGAAHARGIVHRDLKPENLFVTRDGRVKILDFGLARLTHPAPQALGGALTPPTLTQEGTVVGTPAYLAPEELAGQPADARSDVFALGAVLHEMLSGTATFLRSTAAATIAAILRDEPQEISQLRPDVPRPLERLIKRCLAKQPEERPASGREVLLALEIGGAASASGAVPRAAAASSAAPWRRLAERVGLVGLGAALAGAGLLALRPGSGLESPPTVVSSLNFGAEGGYLLSGWSSEGVAVSPSGARLAYVGRGQARRPAIFVRDLATGVVRELPDTANAWGPFWSPDGRFLGFVAEDKLRKVSVDGGAVQVLCDVPEQEAEATGVAWGRDGVILFAAAGSLMRVSADGGRPQLVRRRGPGEVALRFPSFFRDGRRFLFQVQREDGPSRTYAASLDAANEPVLVSEGQSRAVLARTGHLLFVQDGTLFAQRFDDRALRLVGEPRAIATRVANNPSTGHARFSVGDRGPLFYAEVGQLQTELTERDRAGRVTRRLTDVRRYLGPVVGPGGRQIAVEISDAESGQHTIWLLDAARGVSSRLTRPPHDSHLPIWSPDGRQIAFTSTRSGKWLPYRQRVDGVGETVQLFNRPEWSYAAAGGWTPDGQAILVAAQEADGRRRLWMLSASGAGEPRPLVEGDFAALSPDGRWLAAASNETGRQQVFVWPFPALDTRFQVSTDGGNWPLWRPDGRELFFVSEDLQLMSVAVAASLEFHPSRPSGLFALPAMLENSRNGPSPYSVSGAERFVLCAPPEYWPPPVVQLISGWEALAP